jgi:hypothetical protein
MKHLRVLSAICILLAVFFTACKKEISLEQGFTSAYSLQDNFGICLGNTVSGTYVVGRQVTDSNYLSLQVQVHIPGRYTINTDIQNGFSFSGTGNFADTGLVTVRLPARGKPLAEGITTLRIVHDSGFCDINVNVVIAIVNGGGTCNATAAGSYKKDSVLTTANTVSIAHNFATTGSFTVTTDTINGYYFNKTVAVPSIGNTNIVLDGFGTPLATGTNNFTLHFGDGTTCGFSITVINGTGGSTGCGIANGTYIAGTALASTNTVTAQHVYPTTGSYTVTTNTVNGISFSAPAQSITGSGTPTNLTLVGTGTPAAAGTFTYNLDYNDGTNCSFTVTVAPGGSVSTDYFPLSPNSWWSYDDPNSPGDTVLTVNSGSSIEVGITYRNFVETDEFTNKDTFLYRKSTGDAIERVAASTIATTFGAAFANQSLDLLIGKDVVTTGAVWYSSPISTTQGGIVVAFRSKMECLDAAATITINGKTFTNVHVIKSTIDGSTNGSPFSAIPSPLGDFRTQWFAPGVGLIQEQLSDFTGSTTTKPIRNYLVF